MSLKLSVFQSRAMAVAGIFSVVCAVAGNVAAAEITPLTSLDNPAVVWRAAEKHYAVLRRSEVEVVVVDNEAVNDEVLPDHRAGYSGIASLQHRLRSENYFVPTYAGLNFEHIIDGKAETDRRVQFEPRNHPMQLRIVHEHAVELYQSATFQHGLESCQRYELLPDGTIQLTIEVIPRRKSFARGYINLFWASYIQQPNSLDIHFIGTASDKAGASSVTPAWVRGVTPAHGILSTHPSTYDHRVFDHDEPFPLTLVFSLSKYRYSEPWYFGVNNGLALVQMFRPQDQVRFTQSPSGGGNGNAAWDFQYFIDDYEVNRRYQFIMRTACIPFESSGQVAEATRLHREALSIPADP